MENFLNGKVNIKNTGVLKDLFNYRRVFYMLMQQQLILIYNRAIFGIAWIILNPLIYLSIILFVFSHVARIKPESEIPFMLVVFTGLMGWNLFSHFVMQSTSQLKSYQSLISKIYFPRIYVIFCNFINLFTEFFVSTIILCILIYFIGYPLRLSLLFLPLVFLLGLLMFSGAVLITALLSYQYKDFQFLVPFLIQIGFYLSPIWFSPNMLKQDWLIILYNCNPVVGVIDLIRACVLGSFPEYYLLPLICSVSFSFILLILGILFWRKKSPYLIDIGI